MLPPRNVARIRRIPRGLSAIAAVAAILASTPAAVAGPAPDLTSSKEVVKSPTDRIFCYAGAGVLRLPDDFTEPVWAQAAVSCTAPVAEASMLVNIYKDGQLIASRLVSHKGKNGTSVQDSLPCAPGTYTVKMEVLVTFPPEFVPHWATASKTSHEARVTTC